MKSFLNLVLLIASLVPVLALAASFTPEEFSKDPKARADFRDFTSAQVRFAKIEYPHGKREWAMEKVTAICYPKGIFIREEGTEIDKAGKTNKFLTVWCKGETELFNQEGEKL